MIGQTSHIMVKIAVAGGSGQIASEVVDRLAATKKHEILIISRKDPAATIEERPGVTWARTDYTDKAQLTRLLNGIHTVLCYTTPIGESAAAGQKLLIDAAIAAGVKRFAPNEWSTSSIKELPWYATKVEVREYLKELNKDKKVIEYTFFQNGMMIDYLVPEGTSSKHLKNPELFLDFFRRRAIVIERKEQDCHFTFTTVDDLSNVVVRAVEYEGEWPVIGGVQGTTLSMSELLKIGVKARGGKPWDITLIPEDDIRAGNFGNSWIPTMDKEPTMTAEQIEHFSKLVLQSCLLSGLSRDWVVSDEWNRLLPDYKFIGAEEFLVKHWAGRD
ncbi:hypothetical protein BJ875DRAFT_475879 [Amylocarpus encephaloides]|uniref:NmrA-like domain-containing protein n=1 Tax=Amylocarpus encephaloides TaxID=45428 RepID=A0A9P7Y9Q6_9HELO|nr:hypothetical protein BJ875DRAFT_475879 [Amylocarpus encephaloides]